MKTLLSAISVSLAASYAQAQEGGVGGGIIEPYLQFGYQNYMVPFEETSIERLEESGFAVVDLNQLPNISYQPSFRDNRMLFEILSSVSSLYNVDFAEDEGIVFILPDDVVKESGVKYDVDSPPSRNCIVIPRGSAPINVNLIYGSLYTISMPLSFEDFDRIEEAGCVALERRGLEPI